MKQSLRILFLMLLAFAFATTAFAQETIEVGDSVDGEAVGDVIEYEIELEEGVTVAIALNSNDFDPIVRVLDADGEELGMDDDGGEEGRNSLLEFTAEADGTYIIVVDAYEPADGDKELEGDFELSVEAVGGGDDDGGNVDVGDVDLVYDDDVDFDVDGEDELVVTFAGAAGDVVTILTRSEAEQDMLISLSDPNGDEIANNGDFVFGDAFLIRVLLDTDGVYTIRLHQEEDEELEDEIEVEVIETELLDLGEGEQTTVIDGAVGEDYMFFEAEEGTVYELTINVDEDIESSLYIDILPEDGGFFDTGEVTLRNITEAVVYFESPTDGIVILDMEYFGSDEIEVTIEVTED